MTAPTSRSQVLEAFADLLSYPAADAAEPGRRCRALVAGRPAAAHLDAFLARAARARPHELEEVYAATFDLDPACPPYLGHHLAGESPKRGAFMARLAQAYQEDGFAGAGAGGELPDHLTVVLRYLAAVPEGPSSAVVLRDALLPALDKMLAALPAGDDAYRPVLAALREEVTR